MPKTLPLFCAFYLTVRKNCGKIRCLFSGISAGKAQFNRGCGKNMIETITAVNQAVNQFIWGVPAMVCIIGVGLLLSVRTGFADPQISLRHQDHHRTHVPQKRRFRWRHDPLSGGVHRAGRHRGHRQHCRCGRRNRHWRTGCRVLDVVFCPAWHVHQVCRGHAGGALP